MALAGPLALVSAAPNERAVKNPSTDDQSKVLAERAKDYLQQILEVARGPGGLIIGHSRFDTRRPLQEGEDLHPYLHQILDAVWGKQAPKPTVADWYYGENTCWATGYLLWSQMIRYRVTGDAEAMTIARKCYCDLNHIFDLCRPIEPGLLGKPHGGRGGPTTSYDQSAHPILHYAQFAREFGTPAEKEQARRNLLDHGDYYFRRNWVMNMLGNLTRIVDPALTTSAMKYLACVHAAFDVTGEERFREAAVKYVREIVGAGMLPWPKKQYELNFNLFYYSWLGEYWSKTSLADATDWIGNIGVYWEAAQLGLDGEGLLLDGIYDTQTKKFTPTKEGWFEPRPPGHISGGHTSLPWWRSPTGYAGRTLYSLGVAMCGLLARKHGLDDRAHETSRKILLRINRDGLRECWDDGKLPPEMKPFANLFGAEFPALWLTAYWMGREQRLW